MRISERLLTVLVCCLLAAAVPAFGGGKGERELKQAQTYYDQKQFASAMTLLVTIMKEYPDLREEADRLVAKIMEVHRAYNEVYAKLLDALDAQDAARGFKLIEDLNDLDPNPDPAIRQSLVIARQRLQWQEKYLLFEALMSKAAALIAEGKLPEAIATYLDEGLPIARDAFDAAVLSDDLRERALAAVRSLEEASRQAAAQPDLSGLPAALGALLAAPVTDSGRTTFVGRLQSLAQARDLEAKLRGLAAAVRGVNTEIDAANGDAEGENLWLAMVAEFAFGRPDHPAEGIIAAARGMWVTTAQALSDEAVAASDAAGSALQAGFSESVPLAAFRQLAAEARHRASLALAVVEAEVPAYQRAAGYEPSREDRARAEELAARSERVRRQAADADEWEAYAVAEASALEELDALEAKLERAVSSTASDASQLRSGRGMAAEVRSAAQPAADAWAARAAASEPGTVMAARAAVVRDRLASLLSRALDADAALAQRMAAIESSGFETRLAQARARLEQGLALASGTAAGQPPGKWPDLANPEYLRALADVGVLLSDMDAWRARWTAEPVHVSESAEVVRLLAEEDELRTRAAALQADLSAASTAAKAAMDRATQLRGQGDSAYQAGQNQEKGQNYTDALASYTTARASYLDSLSWQENAAVRSRLADLASVIERMTTRAREQSLAGVLALIEKGIREFTGTDFRSSVETLETAKAMWEAAAGGTNTTIEVYLDRAKAALLVTGKQEITRTDPIYEDIRGFMTQAELSYTRAESLQRTGSRSEEYENAIASARSSVQAVTAVVPEYRDARLLALRIDRLELGPTEFAKILRTRVEAALANARDVRSSEVTLRDAYYSLKDYATLEGVATILTAAKRKEIETAIYNLEVRLGLRSPPPDPKKVAESADYYRRANAEYRKNVNDAIQWEAALWLLQKSLDAYPLNSDAQKLRNQIVVKRGTSVDVLSDAELARYRAAQKDYLDGIVSRALAIVDELLQAKPGNPLLKDLRQQIQSAR